MNRNDHRERLHEQVRRRLADDRWDATIAAAVRAKRRTNSVRLAASSAASLAVAAIVVAVVAFGVRSPSDNRYESFISQQIDGTHAAVFNSAGAARGELLVDSGVDAVIDDTLALR